jgi:transcriptional regulator with XRE-family HTH domain
VQIPRLREWRERRALTQVELAERARVSARSVAGYEAGSGARLPTIRRLAKALDVEVTDLYGDPEHPLGAAPPSSQLTLNGALEEERRTDWEFAVVKARRLRKDGRERMGELISRWRASKKGWESYDPRRSYLDAMGTLLQQAYDAETALVEALPGTRPAEQWWPEIQKADRLYIELWRLVQDAGLSIRTNGEQADERVESEKRPISVEEDLVA